MVEEAAGTRMYEVKRQVALKNLEKKQGKLEELEKVIYEKKKVFMSSNIYHLQLFYEDVEPRITKLHEERAKVFELQALEGQLTHNVKLFEAWQYLIAQKKTASGENDVKEIQDKIQNIKNKIEENLNNVKVLEEEVESSMRETENV